MLECLLLRIKSSSTYEHLRSRNLIPLPHPNTLRQILCGMSSEFGFNKQALEAIQRTLRGKSDAQKLGVVCFDEFSIKEDMSFNTQTFRFEGFASLDKTNENNKNLILADHGLVFMFRPLLDNWVQPIAVYASVSAASAEDLQRLLVKALVLLEEHGARVLSVVCDGCTSNKKLWKILGVKAEESDVNNHIILHFVDTF